MPIETRQGQTVLRVSTDGDAIGTEQDATDLIGDAWGGGATVVVIPAERLDPTFFDLSTRIAGEFAQKFVNYRLQLVVLGDVSEHVERSRALRDFAYESNQGRHLWFVGGDDELDARLAG